MTHMTQQQHLQRILAQTPFVRLCFPVPLSAVPLDLMAQMEPVAASAFERVHDCSSKIDWRNEADRSGPSQGARKTMQRLLWGAPARPRRHTGESLDESLVQSHATCRHLNPPQPF